MHTHHEVYETSPRLAPPWRSTSFALTDGRDKLAVVAALWERSRIVAALEEAGFTVVPVRRWLRYLPPDFIG